MPDAAPIKQVLLTVQFQPAMSQLNVLDLAAMRNVFADEYPLFNQVNRAGPMGYQPEVTTMQFALAGMPRLQFLEAQLSFEVMFQEDRISVGWNRTTPFSATSNYPGFEAVLARFESAIKHIRMFLVERGYPDPTPVSGEIAYTDVFVAADPQDFSLSLTKIYNIFDSNKPLVGMTGINMAWNSELAVPDVEGYCRASVVGPEMLPDGIPAAITQMSAHFNVGDIGWEQTAQRFLAVRETLSGVFHTLVNPSSFAISAE
jgi:uncharacterized protein (TIGR04255 family)